MAARKKAVQIEEANELAEIEAVVTEREAAVVEKEGRPSLKGKEVKKVKKEKGVKEAKEGMDSSEEALPLEEAFARLDAIMEQLEQEKISLEDSFRLYQQGMKLLKQCNDSIDRVEKQLIILEEEGI